MSTVTALPPRRSHLIVRPLGERGQHVVKDPFSGAYYHLGPEESFLLLKLDGTCTRDRIRDDFEEEFDEPLEDEDLDDFLELARSSNFIDYADGEPVKETPATPVPAPPRPYEQSILYWRKPVFDPDRLFDTLEPRLRFIWTLPFVVISALLMIAAVAVLWSGREAATSQFTQAMRWQTFFFAWLTLIACTTAHEFAHGLTCKHWGGRVREVGFFLIFFLPAFYCDVSDAWLFREKSKRLWVTLAGAWCDLCIWALAVFAWRLSMPDTLLNYLAWVVMSVTGVRTFFNLNPLLKLDGYYLLSDATGIVNLRQRSWDRFMATLRWLLWGGERPQPQERSTFLLFFGIASWTYSVLFLLVFFGAIVWWWGSSWGRAGAAAGAIAAVFVMRGQFHGLLAGEVRTMIKSRRTRAAAWTAGIALVIAALLWLPVRERASGSFQLRSVNRAEVRAPLAGFLKEIDCREGDHIERGQRLAQLEVPDLPTQLSQKRAQIAESQAKLLMYQYGAARVSAPNVAEEADIRDAESRAEQARLAGLKHEADFLASQLAKLKVISPVTGIVSTPHLDQQIGRYLSHGDLICVVEDPRELEVEIQVPEQDVRFIRPGQEVELHPRATVLKSVYAKVKRIAPAATTQPTQSVVSVYCEISDSELVAGMTGHARIDCGKRRAGRIVLEQAMRLLRTEYWW